jgi:signal transduction histidine kinase
VTNPAIREALRSAKPRFYQASKHHPRQAWICPLHKCEIQQALIVPLLLDNNCIGALWVTRHLSEPTFQSSDLDNLEHLADQAVIALEHALMAGRLQSLAVVEERGRIAREMHDSLAQILGYVSLQTQTIEALVKQGELDAVLGELKQSRQMIKAAQADVRESILSLRTTLSGEIGLIAALEQYVSEFGVQTGIETAFVHHADHDLLLSPLAEAQLVRIVQEALTNVRKHAQATEVRVNLTLTSDEMRISIRDNGVGFEQRAVERGHFGLQTMRERAESVQGTLQVTSKPGDGTHVEVSLPLLQTARRSA